MATYDSIDQSVYSARPAELFTFAGNVAAYYTNAQRDITYNGIQYSADYITHNEIEHSAEMNKQALEITVKASFEVARQYIADIPSRSTTVQIHRFLEGINDFRIIWQGRVVKPVFDFESDTCVLSCEPVFTLLKRMGLRRRYQITCPWALYGPSCGAPKANFTWPEQLDYVQGGILGGAVIAAKANDYFTGGILQYGGIYKLISEHKNGRITIPAAIPGLAAGAVVNVSAGCDKLWTTCRDKFDNYLNYGGFWWSPDKNPFTGDSLHA